MFARNRLGWNIRIEQFDIYMDPSIPMMSMRTAMLIIIIIIIINIDTIITIITLTSFRSSIGRSGRGVYFRWDSRAKRLRLQKKNGQDKGFQKEKA